MIDPAQLSQAVSGPVHSGQRVQLAILDIAFGGEGVARLDDFVIFVPFVLVGEEVEAEITEAKKRFARARLVRVIRPSPDRAPAPCPYFTICGGCQYQHIAYEAQIGLKGKQLADLFQRLGGFTSEVIAPVVPCPKPYGYRNRIMVRSQWDKFKGRLNIGFLRADSRLVVDIEACPISSPAINEMLSEVRRNPPPKGGLKVLLREPVEGWEVPRDSFFQNNQALLPSLVDAARQLADGPPHRALIDAYCGVGFFTVHLAAHFERVAGLEFDQRAVEAARRNAARRQAHHVEFVAGRVEEVFAATVRRIPAEKALVLLDPPRTGCSTAFMELLLGYHPREIIYVSCHPATLARDLKTLCASGGYCLSRVIPLDMFPQTQHLECVAKLTSPDSTMVLPQAH